MRSSTLPSSSVVLEAGTVSAARAELVLIMKGERDRAAKASASSSCNGSFLSSRLMVRSVVCAPVFA